MENICTDLMTVVLRLLWKQPQAITETLGTRLSLAAASSVQAENIPECE